MRTTECNGRTYKCCKKKKIWTWGKWKRFSSKHVTGYQPTGVVVSYIWLPLIKKIGSNTLTINCPYSLLPLIISDGNKCLCCLHSRLHLCLPTYDIWQYKKIYPAHISLCCQRQRQAVSKGLNWVRGLPLLHRMTERDPASVTSYNLNISETKHSIQYNNFVMNRSLQQILRKLFKLYEEKKINQYFNFH
jgi:hypothetical protein